MAWSSFAWAKHQDLIAGGNEQYCSRSMWERYCRAAGVIVFVIDAVDHAGIQVAC